MERGDIVITKQQFSVDGNQVRLRNTFDIGGAKELVREENKENRGHGSSIRCLGHIPPEMWHYDPWLMEARKAQISGDKGKYTEYVLKFFDIHPAFKNIYQKRFY